MTDPTTFAIIEHPDGTATVGISDLVVHLDELGLALDEVSIRMLASELGAGESDYELRVGEWQISCNINIARALVNGTVLTAALVAAGATAIPAVVLAVVVPSMFDLERVKISPADKAVYLDLPVGVSERKHIDDWYSTLTASIRSEITSLEFRDLVGRLEGAGLADVDPFDIVTLDQPTTRRRCRLDLP